MPAIIRAEENVLILRNQGIGDLILITPAIRAVRQIHPNAKISVLVGDWSRCAIEHNTYVDEIISYPDYWIQNKQPVGYLRLLAKLIARKFSVGYIFHSHPFIHLLPYLARIPKLYGFYDSDLKKKGKLLYEKTEWQPNTDRYIADNYLDIPRLAGYTGNDIALDYVITPTEQEATEKLLGEYQLVHKQYIVVAPGGGVNPRQKVFEKRWGSNQFADFIKLFTRKYHIPVILTGSQSEAELGYGIVQAGSGEITDLIGRVPFRQTAALIENSLFLLSNDSAVMHVAVARDIPSLAIFGPSNPKSLLPISNKNQWISSSLECSPCYCNSIFEGCTHLRCMKELSSEQVLDRVDLMFLLSKTVS
jgi:heptosyltransferase II